MNTFTSRADRSPGNPTPDKMSPPSPQAGRFAGAKPRSGFSASEEEGREPRPHGVRCFLSAQKPPERGQDAAAPSLTLQGREAPVPGPGLQPPFPIITQGPSGPFQDQYMIAKRLAVSPAGSPPTSDPAGTPQCVLHAGTASRPTHQWPISSPRGLCANRSTWLLQRNNKEPATSRRVTSLPWRLIVPRAPRNTSLSGRRRSCVQVPTCKAAAGALGWGSVTWTFPRINI